MQEPIEVQPGDVVEATAGDRGVRFTLPFPGTVVGPMQFEDGTPVDYRIVPPDEPQTERESNLT